MRFIVVFILWMSFSVITATVDGHAESASPAILHDLEKQPKLKHHALILSRLRDGADTAYVMVNFTPPSEVRKTRDLKNPKVREQLLDAINLHRKKIVDRVNADEVRIHQSFRYIPAVAAEVTARGLKSLAEMAEVESIEPDRILHAHTAQGIPQMNAAGVRELYDGTGVSIAVCDTGIDYTHPSLGGGGFPNSKVIGGYDFGGSGVSPGSQDGNPLDENGHGTACAGIIAGEPAIDSGFIGGVAPGAKLYAVKISGGSGGSAFESDMIAGWEWSIAHKEDDPNNPILIISTSFGGDCYDSPCGSVSTTMTAAAANAVAAGITIFASAGNDGLCNCISWPACIPDVISVGAVFDDNIGSVGFCVDADSCSPNKQPYAGCGTGYAAWAYTTAADQVAPYSNTAAFLDILAPSHKATTPTLGGALRHDFGGTSAACPYAAGVAASMQSAAEQLTGTFISPGIIRAKLVAAGDPIEYAAAGITKPRVNLGAIDIDDDPEAVPALGLLALLSLFLLLAAIACNRLKR